MYLIPEIDLFAALNQCLQIKIPQKGYKNGKGGRGDLIAEVKIIVPKELTNEEEKLYKELEQISNFNPRRRAN